MKGDRKRKRWREKETGRENRGQTGMRGNTSKGETKKERVKEKKRRDSDVKCVS